jgi:hypothetical protein
MAINTVAYEVEHQGDGIFVIFQTDEETGEPQTVVMTAEQLKDILQGGGHL